MYSEKPSILLASRPPLCAGKALVEACFSLSQSAAHGAVTGEPAAVRAPTLLYE